MSEVALLCGGGASSAAVANALRREFGEISIIVEQKEPRWLFLRRRIRRLGLVAVAGQVAFQALLVPVLRRLSRRRIAEIVAESGLDLDRTAVDRAVHVQSVNDPEALEWLARERPRVVVVNGTRIIAGRILAATDAVFLNTHCGITPEYRGAHGGYWALYRSDRENCGVTVHLVDAGIDTGDVLYQARLAPTAKDNYSTFPYLQLAVALPLLQRAARDAVAGTLRAEKVDLPSHLWSHPTLWHYIKTGWRRGAW